MKKQAFSIVEFKIDHQVSGSFVGSQYPVFSWRMESADKSLSQAAYRLKGWSEDGQVLWDSGKVSSPCSAEVAWGGEALVSRQRFLVQLTVWNDRGESVSTGKMSYETTLLGNCDWKAKWIAFGGNNTSVPNPAPFFRRPFKVTKKVSRARLYAAARGLFVASLNGEKVGNDCFVPGWTDFKVRVQFLTYDVTDRLVSGDNVLGAILGDGWYRSFTSGRQHNFYGDNPELLLELDICYEDGTQETVATGNGRWQAKTGPIFYSDIYDGEFYDARMEMPGWDKPGFRASGWVAPIVGKAASKDVKLVPKCNPPVRRVAEIKPVAVLHPRKDTWIWDMGQNITGNVRIKIGGYPGRLYTIRYGEMLYDDGTLYTLNYRSARSTDYYTLRNMGLEEPGDTYEPTFTFHGFRYVQIDGFQFAPFPVEKVEVTGIVLSCDLEPTGTFECGHAKLNQLYSNVRWGQRDNFLEIPTDCPQRDERLGWTGDAEIFCTTACSNFDSNNFFRKYLCDVRDAQTKEGAVAAVVPDIIRCEYGAAAWADAMVVIPWNVYIAYGSPRLLQENFTAMKAWVDYEERTSKKLVRPDTAFGDWLAFSKIKTPDSLIGTAYFALGARICAQTAEILGLEEDRAHYAKLAEGVTAAFRRKFIGKDGLLAIKTQTAIALALRFNLLRQEDREANGKLLAELVKANGNRLDTGFVGTAHLNFALSESGHAETAYDLYLQEAFPSWLFSVNQGATTIWERWNSYTKEDGFGDVNMNSFNHYAYGVIHEWVVRNVLGIRPASAGFREMELACIPDSRLKYAKGSLKTPYGLVASEWKFKGARQVEWKIAVPANTVTKIVIPDGWKLADKKQPLENLCGGEYTLLLKK